MTLMSEQELHEVYECWKKKGRKSCGSINGKLSKAIKQEGRKE